MKINELLQLIKEQRIKNLKEMIDIQGTDGTWDYDEYQFGLYNGLILALYIMTDLSPFYKRRPAKFIKDYLK